MKKPLLILILLACAAFVWFGGSERAMLPAEEAGEQGEVAIGGDFTLIDQNGNAVASDDLRGRVMLVFFGFTRCPDICPVTVVNLSKAMDALGKDAKQVAPIFITVDPGHDTPAVLKDYLSNFNPHLIGLTGMPEQIRDVAAAYKAYFSEAEAEEEELPDDAEYQHHEHEDHDGDSAAIDHSSFIYMMGKDGKYIRHFSYNASPQELTEAIRQGLN
jgi:protein SCO1